jgi:uncharacterized membrane protein
MEPPPDGTRALLSLDTKVVLFGLLTATLTATGTFFQKMNGIRAGHPVLSGWLILATMCFFPTFVITNKVFVMGGRMSLFVPLTALTYVMSTMTGRFVFGEALGWDKWLGCALIVLGVAAIAR